MRRFNIRVYAIILHEGHVLVCDELVKGQMITKFPGGGLEYGEGIRDCIAREMREEFGMEIAEARHFYTTDFFVASAFDDSQIISVYYLVAPAAKLSIAEPPLVVEDEAHRNITAVKWVPINALGTESVSLVIDRHVAAMIHAQSADSHEAV